MKGRRTAQRRQKRLPPKVRKVGVWCRGAGNWVESSTKVRCSVCRRRLTPKAVYCVGGEFVGTQIPRHKAK